MKNKSIRHKESNTFKFQPFAERIARIDVDVFHRVAHRYEEDVDECDTFFYQTLKKWNVLNCSESYEKFRRELTSDVQILPQLLAQKDYLVSVLLKYMTDDLPLSLQPVLELVVALARDLRQEFYPYYPEFHFKLFGMLNTRNTEYLEWIFTCFAYIFKFLWRLLVRDITAVFESLLPLLSDTKPTYINNFAAESFAFVARKVKDKRSFLKLILRSLQTKEDGIAGCGRLLFEVVQGVPGQFHSCAEPTLTLLFQSLSNNDLPSGLLYQVLTHTLSYIANNIFPKHADVFWKSIQGVIGELAAVYEKGAACEWSLQRLLELCEQALQHRCGILLTNPGPMVGLLLDRLLIAHLPTPTVAHVCNMAATLLLARNVPLSQEHAARITHRVLSLADTEVLMDFAESVFSYAGFEALVLPSLLEFSSNQEPKCVLALLTKLVLNKASPATSTQQLREWTQFLLRFNKNALFPIYLLKVMDVQSLSELMTSEETVLSAILLVAHVQPLDSTLACDRLIGLVNLLCSSLTHQSEVVTAKALFLLDMTVQSLIHISPSVAQLIPAETLVKALLPFVNSAEYTCVLRILDMYITVCDKDGLQLFSKELILKLVSNLSSPYHQVREHTAHLLSELGDAFSSSVLSIIYTVECIPADLNTYREKLRYLRQLECSAATVPSTVALRYLLGLLYINFKLIWEPVTKLISSYAKGLPMHDFWNVFGVQLCHAVQQAKGLSNDVTPTVEFERDFFTALYNTMTNLEERPDFTNYRILLWQAMADFPEVCEVKNRDLSCHYLTFLEEEYFQTNLDNAAVWDIKQKLKVEDISLMDISEELDDNCEIKQALTTGPPLDVRQNTRSGTRSLLAHLNLFAMLRNPRSFYKEAELSKTYCDFLTHKNTDVQRAALDCIMAYKHKHHLPYRDHLYGLIDDRKFKDEVTHFRIDTDSDLIRQEHRPELIPLVMRIVYSKMVSKASVRVSGSNKSAGQVRRAVVLRFLAGCHEQELRLFIEMAFRIYNGYVQEDAVTMVSDIGSAVDLERMVPPKRLLSSISLLVTMMTHCGGMMGAPLLCYLLRLLLVLGAMVAGALTQRDQVHVGYLQQLRNIRTASLDAVAQFFAKFEAYPWTPNEVDAVFQVFVWPWLSKLPVEGIHSPTALLKLFLVWSHSPRYFCLLGKHADTDADTSPLPVVMRLLVGSRTHGSVSSAIMELIERLLTLEEQWEGDGSTTEPLTPPPPPIVVNNLLPVQLQNLCNDRGRVKLNYGSGLLVRHIPDILERLRHKLSTGAGAKKGRGLARRDLAVLSRITELVSDPVTSDTILALLMPTLVKRAGAAEDIITPLLSTAANLIRNVHEPGRYVRHLAPLFGLVTALEPRKILSALTIEISELAGSVGGLDGTLMADLNAWDARWLDQPDYIRRLDAFKRVHQLVDENQMPLNMGIILIHNCFHFLRTEKDLSLRDSAGQCLRKLCPTLCWEHKDSPADRDLLVNLTLLHLIKDGIRDKNNETLQQESISLLGTLARECGDVHPILKDLSLLANNHDPEVDFFENLQHLQLHRKVRALLKYCEVSKELVRPPNPRTLTQFILPLASQFLCSEKYSNKNTIVDAAIEVVGMICHLLPWHQYAMVLRYYLGKLRHNVEHQKQLIRITITILNSFHFDLSRAEVPTKQNFEKQNKLSTDTHLDDTNGNYEERSGIIEVSTVEVSSEPDLIKSKVNNDEECSDDEAVVVNEEEAEEGDSEDDDTDELSELENRLNNTEVEIAEEEVSSEAVVFAIEKQIVLTKSGAKRVIQAISHGLLPQMHRAISMRTQSDMVHKLNKRHSGPDRDEEEILRVPLAVALVKLLQRLPAKILDNNLPGILMKLCTFLKSRMESVRKVTRETLKQILVSLGPCYLSPLVSEMTSLLTRGFQAHVLLFSLHSVLVAIKDQLQPGDIDVTLQPIVKVCMMGLFGDVADEKEVSQIAGKVMEARSNKSYDMFNILAQCVTEKCLLNLILPLKTELERTLSHKSVTKVSECLRQVVLGLVDNRFVSAESLLILAYGTASESIPALCAEQQPVQKQQERAVNQRPDTFIIPVEPRGHGHGDSQTCARRTNAHILVEFGLRLYHMLLKRDKLKDQDYRPHLNPLAALLTTAINSQQVKLSTLGLQCLCWVMRVDLPVMRERISDITKSLFFLLHKYAAAGLSKGDNFDLVMAAFKAVGVLVRDVKYHTLDQDQLRVLLLYCEQDMQDHSRQATAFSLLKSVVGRSLVAPELDVVMGKVAAISITAHLDHVRLQARQVMHQYMMDYPLGKKLDLHIGFYISQLNFDLEQGRRSALEFLRTVIITFPQKVMKIRSGLLFVTLGAQLVNDDSPECRQMAADCITLMIKHLDQNQVDKLYAIALQWLRDQKVQHRRLGAQLCGLFVTCEKESFERRLSTLLAVVIEQFNQGFQDPEPGRFVRLKSSIEEDNPEDESERMQDHHLFQVLQMLVKTCVLCPKLLTAKCFADQLEEISDHAVKLLGHEHEWVRVASVQLLGRIVSVIEPAKVAAAANDLTNETTGFLCSNSRRRLKRLSLDLCAQLKPGANVGDKLLMECLKVLVFIAEVLKDFKDLPEGENLSLLWLIRRFRKAINIEIAQFPSSTTIRRMSFNWLAALAVKLDRAPLLPCAHHIMAPLVREMNSTDAGTAELRQVAREAAGFVRRKLGQLEYNALVAKLVTQIDVKRAERSKERAQQVITDPQKAAKRKINRQQKKKEQKKRKIEKLKGHKLKRKGRRKDVSLEDM